MPLAKRLLLFVLKRTEGFLFGDPLPHGRVSFGDGPKIAVLLEGFSEATFTIHPPVALASIKENLIGRQSTLSLQLVLHTQLENCQLLLLAAPDQLWHQSLDQSIDFCQKVLTARWSSQAVCPFCVSCCCRHFLTSKHSTVALVRHLIISRWFKELSSWFYS